MNDEFEKFLKGRVVPIAVDIYEKDGKVFVEAPLPGIDPKKLKVNIDDSVLTIRGKEEKKSEVEEKNYYRKEVSYGGFCRAVRLPVAVKKDGAEAKFKDGVLTVSIPKAKEEKPKKPIKIKVEEK